MSWYAIAGTALLVLAAAVVLTHRRPSLLVQALPIPVVAILVLCRQPAALVVGAVVASVWLLDQALSWRPHDPVRVHRLRPAAHAAMSALSLVVAVVAWIAVAAAHIGPAV